MSRLGIADSRMSSQLRILGMYGKMALEEPYLTFCSEVYWNEIQEVAEIAEQL